MADTLLKCTTRHVRLFTASLQDEDLVPSDDQLTLDLDPDNEFLWDAASLAKVQGRFKDCLLYTSPSPRDRQKSRMPSSA